jgi:hypothetical protein
MTREADGQLASSSSSGGVAIATVDRDERRIQELTQFLREAMHGENAASDSAISMLGAALIGDDAPSARTPDQGN